MSVRDLVPRLGHDCMRAAMIYLHATDGADRAIAGVLPVEIPRRPGLKGGHARPRPPDDC